MKTHKVLVGTSGWHYDSWRGPFYPPTLSKRAWLSHYCENFPTTELNGVFYRTPAEGTVRAWQHETGPYFVFAWKASKFITHWKRLNASSANSVALLETRLKLLKGKVGPVLFQLPPNFRVNVERLRQFLAMLPKRRQYVFEFRHPSWYIDEIFDLLKKYNAAICLSDHHDAPAPWIATADCVYIRGHGPAGNYKGRYSPNTLRRWAASIRRWKKNGHRVFVYFDNDQKSAAPLDAKLLIEMLKSDAEHGTEAALPA